MKTTQLLAVVVAVWLAGCGANIGEEQAATDPRRSVAQHHPALSEDGPAERVVVLSSLYGFCVGGEFRLGRWGAAQDRDFSSADYFYVDEAGHHQLKVSMGKVGSPDVVLLPVGSVASNRMISKGEYAPEAGVPGWLGVVAVSGVSPDSDEVVWIEFDTGDRNAEEAALELAEKVFACEVSRR